MDLQTLEFRAEQGVERAEQGWREFAEAMREIKESEAYKEAGYRYFQTYYRERWADRTGKAFETIKGYLAALRSVEEMEGVGQDHTDLPPVTNVGVGKRLAGIEDPKKRREFWQEFNESGESVGAREHNLRTKIREHKGELPKPEEPTVSQALSPEAIESAPSKNMSAELDWFHRTGRIAGALDQLEPEEVADSNEEYDRIERAIDQSRRIIDWYERYQQVLIAKRDQGAKLRAVR